MARSNFLTKLLTFLLASQVAVAFAPRLASQTRLTSLQLEASANPLHEKMAQMLTTTAVVITTSPLMALAEEVDDYEYGAVNAPIGIAVAGGLLAILTALLPVFLQGGEKAFNEMKERDQDKWGTGGKDTLNKRK